ncbi:glycosyltransferase [Candidatus Methylobacter oryzae]|uniref:Glycosyltransferase n=2 Tax=Candidatus Methylobacter oryzae TaxID=2497749 RepID=A0ABY3C7Y2_9GAMM|nr:glycosyltransferase [Candidatus Methylobacter oryzae]
MQKDNDSSMDKIENLPLVSLIVRTKNRPALLTEALQSITGQTYLNIEIIVVNDGGDDIDEIIGLFKDDAITIIPLQFATGIGRSKAANAGLDKASGKYIAFLDDDDWLEPEHVQQLLELLENPSHADCVAAYAGVRCIDQETGNTIKLFNQPYNPAALKLENYIPVHAALFRRNVIDGPASCRFDETFDLFEDWDFWLQLQAQGNFIRSQEITANYRIVNGSSGEGVIADESRAIDALHAVIDKWRHKWSTDDIIEIIAHARLLAKLLDKTELLRSQLDLDKQQLMLQLSIANQEIDNIKQANDLLLNSLSWRITKPLRALRRTLTINPEKIFTLKQAVWSILIRAYQNQYLQPLIRLIPFNLKHSLKTLFIPRAQDRKRVRDPKNLKVSIIIPVYNHSKHLRECIDSALKQTYGNLEVVICDDASPDSEVRKILDQYLDQPKIKILYSDKNNGISATQNQLLIASTGDVIAFLDCDDYLAGDAIEIALSAWQDDTVYLHTGRINIDEDGAEVNRISFEHLPRQDYFLENLDRMFATHLKIIHRDAFAKVGLFDPRFDSAQDYDMLMRIAFHYPTQAFVHIPDKLYFHRLHKKQTTVSMNDKQLANTQLIQKEATARQEIRNGKFSHFISIIMLSYGKKEQTLEALLSLEKTVNIPHEIILFDNGSAQETVDFIKHNIEGRFDNLKVFYNDTNLGPAAGRREALQHASGDWFIIFDNDEIAEPGWIEELLVRASSDQNIGAVCCKVIFPDESLQFSGGNIRHLDDQLILLDLYDKGKNTYDLETAQFRECDWCPIGATLFTVNPALFLHDGYPNVFEDAGVSMALRREGKRLVNCPGSWVWHEHMVYRKNIDMKDRYVNDRYDPLKMITSLRSFYKENGLIIQDEYIWRENRLNGLTREELIGLLSQ